ncbi:MAG: tetratricopeptide repeat protein [Rhizobacter sp.]|nr:tetratricopeptide repeat protein [Rhizobacter sp.]
MTDNATLQRLDRLEGYLQQDPDNLSLLADTFDAALEAGEYARAEPHLRHAQRLSPASVAWATREAHWLMAQRRWAEADASLMALQAEAELPPEGQAALLRDLALVALHRGEPALGLDRLRPLVSPVAPQQPMDEAIQLLWLRLLHRAAQLPEALAWAEARWQAQQLASGPAGAASLIALDANDAARSLAWAEFALKREPRQMEALVARATLALAQTDAPLARRLLGQALQKSPTDGRSLSVLGFAELLERKLDAARTTFEAAVRHMPQHIGTWHGLGWTRLLQGDMAAARAAFETALQLDRTFGESHGGLAVMQAMQGEREEAEASIERALRLDRGGASAQFAKAVLRGEAGDAQAVQRLAKRLLGHRPGLMGGSMLDAVQQAVPGFNAGEQRNGTSTH